MSGAGGSLLEWGAVGWLNLLWALPVLGVLLIWAQRRRQRDLARLAALPVLARLAPPDLATRRGWQTLLTLLGVTLMVVAVAQPRIGFQWRDVERRGIDIALVVDVSRSMDAQDVSPSRMERARREVLDLCQLSGSDRLGLVVFAAGAYPRVPLTMDHEALLTILREVDTGTLKAQGSSLSAALREALRLLDQETASDRAILLISDGEVPDEAAALAAAAEVAEADVSIFAMGVGTSEGAPLPEEGGGFKKDSEGQVVVSRLDEPLLRRMAAAAGGAYVRSVASTDDLRALVDEIHSQTEAELLGVHRERLPNEHFQWPLGAGLLCLVLGLLVGVPRRGLGPSAVALLLGLLLVPGSALGGAVQDGILAMEAGDYERAVELLMERHLERPDDMDLALRLGQALQLAGSPNEAERVWEEVAERATDPERRALARYDMGHAAYSGGRLTEARDHFTRAAEIHPELEAAAKNAQAVAQEIAARTQDQQEQQSSDSCDNPQQGDEQEGGEQGEDGEQDQDGEDQEQGQDEQDQERGSGEPQEEQPEQDGSREQGADEPQDPMDGEIQPLGGEGQEPEQAQQVQAVPGELSPEQAARLLGTVEEGSPRVVVGGRPDKEQDW